MAVSIGAGFALHKKLVIDDRTYFETVSDMVAIPDNWMPDMGYAFVKETGGMYIYNRDNEELDDLGKWRPLEGDSSLQKDILVDFTVGGIKEGDTIKAGTSIEEIIRTILKGEKISETALPSYYGVADTKITDLSSLSEENPAKNFSIKVSPKNQYVVIACPNEAGVPVITSFGFDYTSSFTTTVVDDYTFYYSETKITTSDFEYTITYN